MKFPHSTTGLSSDRGSLPRTRGLPLSLRVRELRSALLPALAVPLALAATGPMAAAQTPSAAEISAPAESWATVCAKREELVIQHPGSYLRYRLHEVNQKGDRMRDQIETPQGTVARMIERDGRPLTPEQDAAERARLNAMIASPDDFARHVRRDDEDRKQGLDLLHQMPDAMLWSYAPGQPQLPGQAAGGPPLIVLDFKPDPKWSAPDLVSDMLTGLEGRIWIDPRTQRLVRLQADVFRAVNAGWGFFAHVYPGGTVTLEQTNPGGERWIVRHFDQQFTVRIALVKSVRERSTSDTADYRAVPSMTYQEAIKLLLDTPLPAK